MRHPRSFVAGGVVYFAVRGIEVNLRATWWCGEMLTPLVRHKNKGTASPPPARSGREGPAASGSGSVEDVQDLLVEGVEVTLDGFEHVPLWTRRPSDCRLVMLVVLKA
jgi:hypothetical protein